MTTTKPLAEITGLINAIEAYPSVSTYVAEQWAGSTLTYYVGLDNNVMPEATEAPYLVFRPGNMSPSEDRTSRNVEIDIALITKDTGAATTSGNITTIPGAEKIQDLYFLIETAMETYFKTTHNRQVTYGGGGIEISLPLFRLTTSLTIQGDYE